MGFVKKVVSKLPGAGTPIHKALGLHEDPKIDTSAQEAAAREQRAAIQRQEAAARQAAAESRKAAEQSARNARWQAEGAAQQFASQQLREQLQQAAMEEGAQDFVREEADVQVGEPASPDQSRRRRQFQAGTGTDSRSPSIRI